MRRASACCSRARGECSVNGTRRNRMHLDDGRMQRLLDGELSPSEETAAREHVASCTECRERVEAMKKDAATAAELFQKLDQPEPPIDFLAILEEVRRRGQAERLTRRRPLQWAASL